MKKVQIQKPCSNSHDAKKVIKVTWIGLIVNIALCIFKFVVGVLGASQAVVADAFHSLSDTTTDIAILFGVKYWSAPADKNHPYGHSRIETIITTAIGVAVALVALGIGYKAITTIRDEDIKQPEWIAFAGAVVSIVVKEILYRWTIYTGKRARSSAVIANAWHHRSDALSSIPVAIAVMIAAISPEWSFIDHLGGFVVSIFILYAAYGIIKSSLTELTDVGAPSEVIEKIRELALATEDVKSVHAIRTRRFGLGLHVDLHVLVDGGITVKKGHDISEMVKQYLIEKGPDILDVVVHLEPNSKETKE